MSNRNNDVFQVLVTSGNAAVLAEGSTVDSLAVGQIGFFNEDTKLSFDATTTPIPRNFFMAVGVNNSGGATLEDIVESAGQFIQTKGIMNASFRPHTAGQPMIVTVGGYKGECDTEYGLRVEFRNSRIYRTQGFNQFSKPYFVKTACCDSCSEGCPSGDANEVTILMVNAINNQEDGLLIARPKARQAVTAATHGTSVDYAIGAVMTLADVQALIDYNAVPANTNKVYSDFEIESVPLKVAQFCQVNLHFHKLLQTTLVTSTVAGFDCSGTTVTVTQELAQAEGEGFQIQQKEYHASGWNGAGPYVLSETTGTPMGNITYRALGNGKYDQFILEYDFKSHSGWLEYENPLSTIVAIPGANTTTRNSFAAVLDAITNGAVLGMDDVN